MVSKAVKQGATEGFFYTKLSSCKACRDMELRENRSELATVEIYYSDLCPDAQKRLLDGFALSDPKEANWDIYPVFVLYPEIEDPLDCYDDEEE